MKYPELGDANIADVSIGTNMCYALDLDLNLFIGLELDLILNLFIGIQLHLILNIDLKLDPDINNPLTCNLFNLA